MKYRVIALDGSPKAGKTELAKRIIVCLKAKGYQPVVIESSNSFFNLCDLYLGKDAIPIPPPCPHGPGLPPPPPPPVHPNSMRDYCISVRNHYTGPNMYKDCFFRMPINQYLDMLFKKINAGMNCSSSNIKNTSGCAEFILQSLFALYYQNISAAETALAIDKKAVVILDGSPYETLVWYSIYSKQSCDASKYALDMINKIRARFPSVFDNMLYVLTHTEPIQIYDRTKFDCRAFSEYQAIYQQLSADNKNIDVGSQVQIGIAYTNDIFQNVRNVVRRERIKALTVPGNYVEEIARNAMNILEMFPPQTTKNDGFPRKLI
ncbi:MAG: hypothetical protein J6C46_00410 [Clostridia bacterium]|nr:hypothetical protein [Clostridia bacterium]